jgi:hypothetical protein
MIRSHGYTIHQAVDHWAEPDELLERIGATAVAVFLHRGEIGHSGRLDGNVLVHFLIGVGVVRSVIGTDKMGYDQRFDLPAQRDELNEALKPKREKKEREAKIMTMVRGINKALSKDLEGTASLSKEIFKLQDGESERDINDVFSEYEKYAKRFPEITKDDSSDEEDN